MAKPLVSDELWEALRPLPPKKRRFRAACSCWSVNSTRREGFRPWREPPFRPAAASFDAPKWAARPSKRDQCTPASIHISTRKTSRARLPATRCGTPSAPPRAATRCARHAPPPTCRATASPSPDAFRLARHERLEQPLRHLRRRPRRRNRDTSSTHRRPRRARSVTSALDAPARPRRLDGVAQHVQDQLAQLARVAVHHGLAGRRLPAQVDARVLALRPQQLHRLAHQRRQRTRRRPRRPLPTQVEEALQVRLQQRQLPQGHVQRRRVHPSSALACKQLHRQPGAGQAVAQLVRQAAAHLAQ